MNPQQAALQARKAQIEALRRNRELEGERDRALAREAGAIAAVRPLADWQRETSGAALEALVRLNATAAKLDDLLCTARRGLDEVERHLGAIQQAVSLIHGAPPVPEFDETCSTFYERMRELLEERARLEADKERAEEALGQTGRRLAELRAVPPRFLRDAIREVQPGSQLSEKGLAKLGLACVRWALTERQLHAKDAEFLDAMAAADKAQDEAKAATTLGPDQVVEVPAAALVPPEEADAAAQHAVERAEGRDGTVPGYDVKILMNGAAVIGAAEQVGAAVQRALADLKKRDRVELEGHRQLVANMAVPAVRPSWLRRAWAWVRSKVGR